MKNILEFFFPKLNEKKIFFFYHENILKMCISLQLFTLVLKTTFSLQNILLWKPKIVAIIHDAMPNNLWNCHFAIYTLSYRGKSIFTRQSLSNRKVWRKSMTTCMHEHQRMTALLWFSVSKYFLSLKCYLSFKPY